MSRDTDFAGMIRAAQEKARRIIDELGSIYDTNNLEDAPFEQVLQIKEELNKILKFVRNIP